MRMVVYEKENAFGNRDCYFVAGANSGHCPVYRYSNRKRMLPRKAASSYQLPGPVLVHFRQDAEWRFLPVLRMGRNI